MFHQLLHIVFLHLRFHCQLLFYKWFVILICKQRQFGDNLIFSLFALLIRKQPSVLIGCTHGPSLFLCLSYRSMLAALVVLIMIAISNYSALFFCCVATDYYGLWLQTYHRKDLFCLRVLVRQSVCVCVYGQMLPQTVLANYVFALYSVHC